MSDAHGKGRLLTIIVIFLGITDAQFIIGSPDVQGSFPAASFFNISEDEVKSISRYLCNKNTTEKKCCNCNGNIFHEIWCIDIFWNDVGFQDLTEYLDYLTDELMIMDLDYKYTCQPAFYPLLTNQRSEHLLMYTTYFDNDGMAQQCPSSTKQKPRIPVYSNAMDGIYVDKECAELEFEVIYP